MRNLLSIIALVLCSMAHINAQTILVDMFKPTEENQLRCYKTRDGKRLALANQRLGSGFIITAPSSGLIGSNKPGIAVYNIKGAYSKISFVLGPGFANSASNKYNAIVTVTGDGKRLLDRVVWAYDAPSYITLDVTGVNELKFTVLKGGQDVAFANVKLWKAGQKVIPEPNPMNRLPKGKIKLVEQLKPHFTRHSGWVNTVSTARIDGGPKNVESVSINRKEFKSGLVFTADEGLSDEKGWSYFWLNKRYDKISFIIGPRDNQSSNASAWLEVKADKKIIYEGMVTQKDIAQQVVLDVAGAEQISFISERRSSDFLGSITFGVVDIYAYPTGYTASLPTTGAVNLNKDKISKLPDVCPLLSNIRPFSVRGMSKADNTIFYGESQYYTFSMGGTKYWEGLLLTTGNTLLSDRIDSYAEFDLAGEFDWISFDAGCLSKNHILDDDVLRIYADDKLIFEKMIHCTWPNQHFEVPVNKCRTLRFAKPGNGKEKQVIIGLGDITLYRGKPVPNDLFVHEVPDCPYETDLIDLCGRPYFHYVGRFVSTLTGFNMDNCFHDGSSVRSCFHMKDKTTINKGFMLETNIPLGLENVTVMDAVFMFLTGVGASVSSSDVSAATGVSAGSSFAPPISLLLSDSSNKQSSAAAFNPFGEYETCTFTVANMTEHVDAFDATFGVTTAPPVKLNVFADQRLVGEYWLDNKMQPTTITVPIFKCKQLMFWLECGDVRSGQYVFYDLKVSKAPCNIPIPETYSPTKHKQTKAKQKDDGKKKKKGKGSADKVAKAAFGVLNSIFK